MCPGYTTSLPAVRRATQLYAWYEKGNLQVPLDAVDSEATPLMVECIDALAAACGELNAEILRDAKG